jgi:hypothetical protein
VCIVSVFFNNDISFASLLLLSRVASSICKYIFIYIYYLTIYGCDKKRTDCTLILVLFFNSLALASPLSLEKLVLVLRNFSAPLSNSEQQSKAHE